MVGRFIFRITPWWLMAFFALSFLPLTLNIVQDTIADRAAFEQAMTAPPPDPVPLSSVSTRPTGGLAGEMTLIARWRRDLGIAEIEKDGLNHAYAVLETVTPPQRFAALYVPFYQRQTLSDKLDALAGPDDMVQIGGFVGATPGGTLDVRAHMDQRGLTGKLFTMVPILGDRQAAIKEQMSSERYGAAVMLILQAALAITAFMKFRGWRKQRQGRPAVAQPPRAMRSRASAASPLPKIPRAPKAAILPRDRKPATQPTPTSTQAKDPYANSPIQTQKGWFR